MTSSVIICVTGFNVSVGDNILMMGSFLAFLIFGLMEIFFYCYYGDIIMRSLFLSKPDQPSLTSQKPCKLTACGFSKINLYAFTSILSSSWSYFALLKTMYHPE
ncbi:hypothetical protein HF086_011703 [Spodoptera exigua]|uniref:Uncharacterized protein n=1 Tax=Spodoptera exigua TaxID=7107 RepID=A0A922MSH7_SPOEX|nr:hypothetical protein HF086_011703 [Spodoptera exigua]